MTRGNVHAEAVTEHPFVGAVVAGRYRVTRLLHEGGLGDVFAAYDEQERAEIALKVFAPHWAADRMAASRIQRDLSTLMAIEVPAIVPTHAAGRLDDGRPFVVMERLAGVDLRALLARQSVRLFPEEAAHLLSGVAAALDVAHATGLVHRALTPGKLFLVPGGAVKLLGFGVGSMLTPQTDATRPTREVSGYGELAYLAPEVDEPDGGDARADVYSLAVIVFELLTGVLPTGGVPAALALAEKKATPAKRLGDASGIPFSPAVEAVMAVGLARDRSERYRTAGELLTDIVRAAHGLDLRGPVESARLTTTKVLEIPRATSEEEMVGFLLSDGTRGAVASSEPPIELVTRARRGATIQGMPSLPMAPKLPVVEVPETSGKEPVVPRRRKRSETFDAARVRAARAASAGPGTGTPLGRRLGLASVLVAAAIVVAAGVALGAGLFGDEGEEAAPVASPPPAIATPDEDEACTRARALSRDGLALLERARLVPARRSFLEAIEQCPDHPPAWLGLGRVQEQMDELSAARHSYARYLELSPDGDGAPLARRSLRRLESIDR